MFHCSAAEGQKFQNEATRITEIIQKLGNNPLKNSIPSKKKEKNSKEVKKKNKTE